MGTDINWDYLAGWFDGEGSVVEHTLGYPCLFFGNTDLKVIEAIKFFTKTKANIILKKLKPNCKQYYVLEISSVELTLKIATELEKRCITKKEKLFWAIKKINERPIIAYGEKARPKWSAEELLHLSKKEFDKINRSKRAIYKKIKYDSKRRD